MSWLLLHNPEHPVKLFARHLIRWQWMVVVLLVGVTGSSVWHDPPRVDPSNERLLPRQGDDALVCFLATFGSDEDILVATRSPQSLLAPEGLAAVRHLTQACYCCT
jgi:hypothetical protein